MATAAAFYDLDGTLVRTNLVHAFAYNAKNQQGLMEARIRGLAKYHKGRGVSSIQGAFP